MAALFAGGVVTGAILSFEMGLWAHAFGVACFLAFVASGYRAVLGGDILDSDRGT
jgi:hypothetical protein